MDAPGSSAAATKEPLSPLWVGVAIALLPPLGIYLLWRHPVLSKSDGWKKVAYAWCGIWLIAQASNAFRDDAKKSVVTTVAGGSTPAHPGTTDPPQQSPGPQPSGESAAYMRGWRETYAGGQRWGAERRRAPSEQIDEVIDDQIFTFYSTLEALEDVKHTGGAAEEAYEAARGRLDGFRAGLDE